MSEELTFHQAKEKYFKTLEQYVPIVDRVHGDSHPEFHEVRLLFAAISRKTKVASSTKPDLNEEFAKLRKVTNYYTVPEDVCESYEAVYKMLAVVDNAYQA
jgi:regulator of cell morphogenesis and NO signaling